MTRPNSTGPPQNTRKGPNTITPQNTGKKLRQQDRTRITNTESKNNT